MPQLARPAARGEQPRKPARVEEAQLAQVEHHTGRPRLLHAAQFLVERVRVSEVQLASQRDAHRASTKFLDREAETGHYPVPLLEDVPKLTVPTIVRFKHDRLRLGPAR